MICVDQSEARMSGTRDKGLLGPSARTLRGGPGPDLSQLKSPIQTSVSGTRQVRAEARRELRES